MDVTHVAAVFQWDLTLSPGSLPVLSSHHMVRCCTLVCLNPVKISALSDISCIKYNVPLFLLCHITGKYSSWSTPQDHRLCLQV